MYDGHLISTTCFRHNFLLLWLNMMIVYFQMTYF